MATCPTTTTLQDSHESISHSNNMVCVAPDNLDSTTAGNDDDCNINASTLDKHDVPTVINAFVQVNRRADGSLV